MAPLYIIFHGLCALHGASGLLCPVPILFLLPTDQFLQFSPAQTLKSWYHHLPKEDEQRPLSMPPHGSSVGHSVVSYPTLPYSGPSLSSGGKGKEAPRAASLNFGWEMLG